MTKEEHLAYIEQYETGYRTDGTSNGKALGVPCHLCSKWVYLDNAYYYTCKMGNDEYKSSLMLFYHVDCFANAAGPQFTVDSYIIHI